MAKATSTAGITAQRETIETDSTIEGVAWLEAAEDYTRHVNEADLALALLYLRSALKRGEDSTRINLAEALRLLNRDMQKTLDRAAELDFSCDAMRELATDEGVKCARLVASGWRWFVRIGPEK